MINRLEWGGFIAVFLLFDIQLIIYATLNISLPVSSHYVYLVSLSLSWAYYFMLPSLMIFLIYFTYDKKWRHLGRIDHKSGFKRKYGLLFERYIPKKKGPMPHRNFMAVTLLRHYAFANILIFLTNYPILQCSLCFGMNLGYLALIYFLKPHKNKFEWYLDCLNEAIFSGYSFCYFVFAWNEKFEFLRNVSRGYFGWIVVLLVMSCVALNSIYIVAPVGISFYKIIFKSRIERKKQEKREIEKELKLAEEMEKIQELEM